MLRAAELPALRTRPSALTRQLLHRPQPGLVYLRGLSTDKVFSLTIERVPHTENVVRPLTFALELSVAEASEDLFMLRIAGASGPAAARQADAFVGQAAPHASVQASALI